MDRLIALDMDDTRARYGLPRREGGINRLSRERDHFALSDIRLKEDLRPIGTTDEGLTIYSFRYKGDPTLHRGVVAQEVREVRPDAVMEIDGFLHVDYGRLGLAAP